MTERDGKNQTGKRLLPAVGMLALLYPATAQQPMATTPAPSPRDLTLPNGRQITPQGSWVQLAPFPYTLALRPDRDQIVVPAIGWPFSLNILDHPASEAGQRSIPEVRRLPATLKNNPEIQVHTGVVYSPDGALLYDTTGDTGAVHVYSTASWERVAALSLDGETAGQTFRQSFSAAAALSHDGRLLYTLDQGNWRVVVIDTRTRTRIASLQTGSNPFSIALSPDGSRLYVTNSGLFEYTTIEGAEKQDILHTGLSFPASGYPSRQARQGTTVEGHRIAGLGDENDVRGSSVWTYDVSHPARAHLVARLRLGAAIGADSKSAARRALGGASPTSVVASSTRVYVSLAHQDSIAVLSSDGTHQLDELPLSPFSTRTVADRNGRPLRGVMPAGLALHGDRLYVAEAGINAVAVVDTSVDRVLGHIPVGWYPTAVAVSNNGSLLYVVNTKGAGSGPNGGAGFHPVNGRSYIGELEFGSLSAVPLGDEQHLQQATAAVIKNNEFALSANSPLPKLKHVFLIIRENRTFDEILGDLSGADGDPSLARWSMRGWLVSQPTDKTVRVTPNAHALAKQFGTSDRFFTDSDVSADGHRWIMGAAPTPWFHVAWTSNYGGRRTGDEFGSAPGRRALSGGNDAPMPEDEPEFGTLWEHVADNGLRIRNYGEGLEVEGSQEIAGSEPSGQRVILNSPLPQPIFQDTDRSFPTFNLGIPDQYRFDEFARDFDKVLGSGSLPSLIVIRLPGDHTAGERPSDGYPDRGSYVADNDLALGRIVELISHRALWKDSAIFVTEDDAQGGVDHVDAHRSVLLAISPYVRQGVIAHRHSSMSSILKTIYELLGLGPLNLEDYLASDLSDMFTKEPNLTPFDALPADPRVFDPKKARVARPKNAEQARELLDCDDPVQIAAEFKREAKASQSKVTSGRK